MSFNINNNLVFIDSLQFLSFSLDSFIKNLGKSDFNYLSPEFDNNVLVEANQKGFYPYEFMIDFEKFKEESSIKKKFCSSLTGKKNSDKEYEHVLLVWNAFLMKSTKIVHKYHDIT